MASHWPLRKLAAAFPTAVRSNASASVLFIRCPYIALGSQFAQITLWGSAPNYGADSTKIRAPLVSARIFRAPHVFYQLRSYRVPLPWPNGRITPLSFKRLSSRVDWKGLIWHRLAESARLNMTWGTMDIFHH